MLPNNLYMTKNLFQDMSWDDDEDTVILLKPRKVIVIWPNFKPPKYVLSPSDKNYKLLNAWNFHIQYKFNKWKDLNFSSCNALMSEFATVNDFWQFYDNFPLPSEVFCVKVNEKLIEFSFHKNRRVESFCLFKKGITPTWEDPQNKIGGHYEYELNGNFTNLDELWKLTILLLISGGFSSSTGIRVVDKSRENSGLIIYRLEIWMTNRDDDIINLFSSKYINNIQFEWKKH